MKRNKNYTLNLLIAAVAPICFFVAAQAADTGALLVQQQVDINGSSSIKVLLDNTDITDEVALSQVMNNVAPIPAVQMNGKTKEEASALAKKYYADNNAINTYLGNGAAVIAEELGLNGAVIQMVQKVSLVIPDSGESYGSKIVIEGFTFLPSASIGGGGVHTAHGAVRVLPDDPRYIVAQYFPAKTVEEFWLQEEHLATVQQAVLLETAKKLSDTVVYQVFDVKTSEPIGGAITLSGYKISIAAFPDTPTNAIEFSADTLAEVKCLTGFPLAEIHREAEVPATNNADTTITQLAPLSVTECPQANWNSRSAGTPRSILTLIEDNAADYALLVENTALKPAEWQDTGNGALTPVTRQKITARELNYSCFYASYRQTETETLPLAGAQKGYYVSVLPEPAISPIGSADIPPVEIELGNFLVTANAWGDSLTLALGNGLVTVYQPYRFGYDISLAPPQQLAPYVYDTETGNFLIAENAIPALTYDYSLPLAVDTANGISCAKNGIGKGDLRVNAEGKQNLKVDVVIDSHRRKTGSINCPHSCSSDINIYTTTTRYLSLGGHLPSITSSSSTSSFGYCSTPGDGCPSGK